MSDQVARRITRVTDLRATLPWLVGAVIYALLVVLGPRLLADPDSYSHIAVGRWMLEHLRVPTVDPFSQTMRGAPWTDFEWLSQLAFTGAYAFGGWMAVVVLTAAAAAAAFGQLTRFLLRYWQPVPALIAVLVALVLVSPHILARPHVLVLPLMVAWIAALIQAVDDKRAPSWWLLALMLVWANMHGSFVFGLAMIVPLACDAMWSAPDNERRRVAQQWIVFAALGTATACLNPYGSEMLIAPLRTMALGKALATIVEWRPQDFSHLDSFEVIMLAGFGIALYRGVKLPPWRIVMLLGVLHLSLSQQRHADLLGMLAPLFLARPLAEQFNAVAAAPPVAPARASGWHASLLALALMIVTGFVASRDRMAPAANITPAKALAAIDVTKAGPILNDYNFGGYLDFVGLAPFIDGRGEIYGGDFAIRYASALSLRSVPDFLRLLDEYKFKSTLLAPSTPAVALLDRLPEWQRVYTDDVAVVHQRVTLKK